MLIGRGGEPWFSGLESRFPQVRYIGVRPPAVVASILAESRSILFSSRWESGPIAAWEALAVGCSVIGTPIPNLIDICAGGQFGRTCSTRRPADLARAIHDEMADLDTGLRQPHAIAEHWRAKVHPTAVCRKILDALAM